MQIEAGKRYRTRDGLTVTLERNPLYAVRNPFDPEAQWPFIAAGLGKFHGDGTYRHDRATSTLDIVALADDGPVRTVQRKEIVPGTYGLITVWPDQSYGHSTRVSLGVAGQTCVDAGASDLRSAAAAFLELADALEGK